MPSPLAAFACASYALLAGTLACSLACMMGGCTGAKVKKSAPDAAPPARDAGAPTAPLPPPPSPALQEGGLGPGDRALVDQTRTAMRDLDALVKRGLLADPDKVGEDDANIRCTSLEAARPRLEDLPDDSGEMKTLLAEQKRLCSLEVPILNCQSALRQASLSPSQASRRLVCGLAQKDFEKARAAKPMDRRIFELGQRLAAACR